MAVKKVGVNIAHHVFRGHGLDADGEPVRKTIARAACLAEMTQCPACLVRSAAGSRAPQPGRAGPRAAAHAASGLSVPV